MKPSIWKLHTLIWGMIISIWSIKNIIHYNTPQKNAFIILFIIGFLLIIIGFFKFRNNRVYNYKDILITILTAFYIFIEISINIYTYNTKEKSTLTFEPNSGFGYFNHPCADYDPVRGYRWKVGEHRIFKYHPSKIIYDNTFNTNNQGYYYKKNFQYKKEPGKQRWLILGDSFTAAEYLKSSLADQLDSIAFAMGMNIEFYPFALNGSGINNWHRIFVNEILPHYEFDGIIFNIFANDLRRPFFVMHHTDTMGYTGWLDKIPQDKEELFSKYQKKMEPNASFLSDSQMNELNMSILGIKSKEFNPDFFLLQFLLHTPILMSDYKKMRDFRKTYFIKNDEGLDVAAYENEYGTKGKELLIDIIQSCKNRQISTLLVQIPYNLNINYNEDGYIIKDKKYVKYIADQLNVPYYDSETLYHHRTDIDKCFFEYDIHWNERGSTIFTVGFLKFFHENFYK